MILTIQLIKNAVNCLPSKPLPSLYTKYEAQPIELYNVVHTGPKAQFGGLHSGFFKPSYQGLMLFFVINPPAMPPKLGRTVKPIAGQFISIIFYVKICRKIKIYDRMKLDSEFITYKLSYLICGLDAHLGISRKLFYLMYDIIHTVQSSFPMTRIA